MSRFSDIGWQGTGIALAVLVAVAISTGCTEREEPAAEAPTAATIPAPTAASVPGADAMGETVERGVLEVSKEGDLVVFVDADVEEGPAPLTVTFEVELEGGEAPIQWRWNYGDGQTGSAQETRHRHTFTEPGTYRIELEVEDATGETDFDLVEVVVNER